MKYIPSINIEAVDAFKDFEYFVTPNAQKVLAGIVSAYQNGNRSFTIIGTYGTGKSSFLMALERDLKNGSKTLVKEKNVFGHAENFAFLNVQGSYEALSRLLMTKLEEQNVISNNIFDALDKFFTIQRKQEKFVFLMIDEFGKILEHAANNNPEDELYFLQQLAEYFNNKIKDGILLTTLHQNFSAYAYKLSESQRNEWNKVKGRFKEVVFSEPIEQLLYLTAEVLGEPKCITNNYKAITGLAKKYKIISADIQDNVLSKLYPLDPIAAYCLTISFQRYGQNERTLFSFLSTLSESKKVESETSTYNLSEVYDYIIYNFISVLSEANADSMSWRSMCVAIERASSGILGDSVVSDSLKIIKTIGLLNLFCGGTRIDNDFLVKYAISALDIKGPDFVINKMCSAKVIRFATYKEQYILFEGTDIDIEDELLKAATIVPVPSVSIDEILPYFSPRIIPATASFLKTGMPRNFEYKASNEPITIEPEGDIDGFIDFVFPVEDCKNEVVKVSSNPSTGAIVYCYFNDCTSIINHLYEIKKLQYLLEKVAIDDKVAKTEIETQRQYEADKLNQEINRVISSKSEVSWYFGGKEYEIESRKDLSHLLNEVCDLVYFKTPAIHNESINKQKASSAISLARANFVTALVTNYNEPDLGFDEKTFPPEKTAYYTLLKNSGMHHQDASGAYVLSAPTSPGMQSLWEASCDFVSSTVDKPRKLGELIKILSTRPYKLKRTVIDFWLPIFLFTKQQDLALYYKNTYVLDFTKEVFDLMQKFPNEYAVKGLNVSSVQLSFFNKYREFLRKDELSGVQSSSLLETIKPFFSFYRNLNEYAKSTRKFDNISTTKFRDTLSVANDPVKTFFVDLPEVFGYSEFADDDFVEQYLGKIRAAVHELVICYDLLIDRIERSIIEKLGLPADYSEYKDILTKRYNTIDGNILTPKTRSFMERVKAPSDTKKEFYEKICSTVLDKSLTELKDKEEAGLIEDLIYLFSELDGMTSISNASAAPGEEVYNFQLLTSSGKFSKPKTYRLSKDKQKEANNVTKTLSSALTGDKDLDICILLKLLNNQI